MPQVQTDAGERLFTTPKQFEILSFIITFERINIDFLYTLCFNSSPSFIILIGNICDLQTHTAPNQTCQRLVLLTQLNP